MAASCFQLAAHFGHFTHFFQSPPPPKGGHRSTKCHKIDKGGQGGVCAQPWPTISPISHDLVEPTSTYHPAKKVSQNDHQNGIVGLAKWGVRARPEGHGRCTVGQRGPLGSPSSPPGTHTPGPPPTGPCEHCKVGIFSSQTLQKW